jgi:hypothetical protein
LMDEALVHVRTCGGGLIQESEIDMQTRLETKRTKVSCLVIQIASIIDAAIFYKQEC